MLRPSTYRWLFRANVIVALDANFAQRRRHSADPDPKYHHPESHFLNPQEVDQMEKEVQDLREKGGTSRTYPESAPVVSDEVLDHCEKVFIAAQGHHAKTSQQIFADTAVMALVCRHDRPLLLANMTSAGERQHYALALLRNFFQQLPADWSVGLLYDIACQLERSMRKVCLPGLPGVQRR